MTDNIKSLLTAIENYLDAARNEHENRDNYTKPVWGERREKAAEAVEKHLEDYVRLQIYRNAPR